MEDAGKKRLQDAALRSLRMEYDEPEREIPGREEEGKSPKTKKRKQEPLSEKEIERLSQKILALPEEYQSILYCRYCFSMSCKQTEQILGIEQVHGKLAYCRKLLDTLMGAESPVDEAVLKRACEAALPEYTKADVKFAKRKYFYRVRNVLKELYGGIWLAEEGGSGKVSEKAAWWRKNLEDMWDEEKMIREPEYSPEFRRQLKDIPAARQTGKRLRRFIERVLFILLTAAFLFMGTLFVNPTWRDQFFDWAIIEILHGEFRDPSDRIVPVVTLDGKEFQTGWIPEELFWRHSRETADSNSVYYEAPDGGYLWIILRVEEAAPPIDSRGAAVETCDLSGKNAYRWSRGDDRYLLWNEDSVQYRLVSNLSWEELFHIAENIVPVDSSPKAQEEK